MVFVLRPDGEITGQLQFVIQQSFPPVQGIQEVAAGPGIGCVFIKQKSAEPGVFPAEGIFHACREGVRNIIAILFGFGDTGTAAVLQG